MQLCSSFTCSFRQFQAAVSNQSVWHSCVPPISDIQYHSIQRGFKVSWFHIGHVITTEPCLSGDLLGTFCRGEGIDVFTNNLFKILGGSRFIVKPFDLRLNAQVSGPGQSKVWVANVLNALCVHKSHPKCQEYYKYKPLPRLLVALTSGFLNGEELHERERHQTEIHRKWII